MPRPQQPHSRPRPFPRPAPPRPVDPEQAAGRMVPLQHAGPLPWVQLRNATFHSAIFRKMIGRADPAARPGDLVRVYDRDGTVFGAGLYNPQSQIGLRMLTFDAGEVGEDLIAARLKAAIAFRREQLKLDDQTTAYRLVHAEGDALPGLIVDRFGSNAVVELFNMGMARRRAAIGDVLREELQLDEVLFRADERVQNAEGFTLESSAQGPTRERAAARQSTVITEHGLRFQIDLTHGHKTGFFCDQRDNRLALTRLTPQADVLDICCYTGGFGVHAATLGKAKSVVCVDLDEDAVALAQRNANLNHVKRDVLSTVHADAFAYLRQMHENGKRYDVLVLDPPKFVPTRESFAEGRGKYFDLNRLGLTLLKPGGYLVTCSCSGLVSPDEFLNIVRGAARSAQRRVQVFATTGAGADHPVMTDTPESAYLKCLWCRVL